MQKILFLILCVSCLSFAEAADFSADARGTTGAQFLELPVGARAIAMGSAYSSISGDPFSAYYNPAGIAGMDKLNIGLMHAVYFQDISYEYGVFTFPIRELGVIGVSVQYLSVSELAEIDKTGVLTGDSFKPNDMALSAIYAKQLGLIDFGVSVKYIKSQIRNSASTFAGDIGLQTKVGKYALGLSVLNIGKGLKFHNEESSLPTTVRTGVSGFFNPKWFFSVDGVAPKGTNPFMAAGIEYRFVSNQKLKMSVRVGYNSRYVSSKLDGISGVNVGAGLDFGDTSIDYSCSLYGDLGSTHRFSVTAKFGNSEKKAERTIPTTMENKAASVVAQSSVAFHKDYTAPIAPATPDGPSSGTSNFAYSFSTVASDFNGNQIKYGWDWGDGGSVEWSGFVNSGSTDMRYHNWVSTGTYNVKVKAQDIGSLESDWSVVKTVIIISPVFSGLACQDQF